MLVLQLHILFTRDFQRGRLKMRRIDIDDIINTRHFQQHKYNKAKQTLSKTNSE